MQREAESGLEFAQKVRFGLVIDNLAVQLGLIRTLSGLTPKFGSFNDEGFDELRFERHLASNPVLALLECWYWIRKLQARFFAGDYASAIDASLRAQQLLWTSPSHFETAEYCFYSALCHAAAWDSASPDQKQEHFEALAAHHNQLEVWAAHCPENFENRAALVGAEIARMEGRVLNAEELYDKAIRGPANMGSCTTRPLPTRLPGVSTRSAVREDRCDLFAGRAGLLPAVGSRWKGTATRGTISAPQGGQGQLPAGEHDSDTLRATWIWLP